MEAPKEAETEAGARTVAAVVSKYKIREPTEFSWARKVHITIAGFTCTFNCNLGSSMPSGALVAIAEQFNVTDRTYLVLLNSLYMAGYVLGPLFFGPLSEYVGRRPVLISTFLGYLAFMAACSAAPSYGVLLIFRLLGGICASAPTTVISGLYADIYDNPSHRGTAMSLYLAITTVGPLIGPMISGFASEISWRWPFWIAIFIAVPGLPLVLMLPETYVPVLLNKAARLHEKHENPTEQLDRRPVLDARKVFVRPAVLMVTEPMLPLASLYVAFAYAIMFLTFQAYPIIFQEHFGLSPGEAGLAYVPMIVGTLLTLPLAFAYTRWYDNSRAAGKEWAQREVYRRLPLACFAAPCMVVSLFWLGWTSWPGSVSPVVPMLSGFLFGLGTQMLYISVLNYITDVFCQLSASAHAGASVMRSITAVLLPLSTQSMYKQLDIHWAPSLLGFLAVLIGVIPFLFIKHENYLSSPRNKLDMR